MKKKVGIIGSGIGGLTSSIYLAKMGFEVDLFEKNPNPGGKVNQTIIDNFRFDIGPSLITMPFVFEQLFDFAGFDINDYLKFVKIDPICRYFWEDGTQIDTFDDAQKMRSELEKISITDSKKYSDYLDYTKQIYELTKDIFIFEPFQEKNVYLKLNNLKRIFDLRKIDTNRTVDQAVRSFFNDPKIVQLFNRYATYNGSNPYKAPATLNVIPWVEFGLGGYYIKGGIYKLAEALFDVAHKLGVNFNFESKVDKIIIKDKVAKGLIVDQKKYIYDYILANSDSVETFQKLTSQNKVSKKLSKLEPSLSGMVFLWGVDGDTDLLKHHNIIFSEDYQKEFDDLINKKISPNDPTVYISITSKSDPGHAPKNSENWFVLVNMPYVDGQDWEKEVQKTKKNVLKKLEKVGISVKEKIKTEKIISPLELYKLYNSNKGSIYGLSSNSKFSAFLRPANRSRRIKNLFFAGGSSHPGGGVPLVALSGKMAADLILKQDIISKEK